MKIKMLFIFLTLGLTSFSQAQIATVDGTGGVPTGDSRYPTSYVNIKAALDDVILPANDVAPGNTIRVTAPVITETTGTAYRVLEDLTVESTVSGGSHVKLKESDIGLAGGVCGMLVIQRTGKSITFKDLIFTPTDGPAGPVSARLVQVYNASADVANAVLTFQRCYFTAIRPTSHAQAGQPILNPFVHAASADTIAARNSELRSFDGGGGNNIIELRQNSAPVAGSSVTWNFEDCVMTHVILAAAASRGGGIVVTRNSFLTLNVKGCVFSFNSGSGIRTAVSATTPASVLFNIDGSPDRPNIFYKNGWMEDVANAARSEGLYMDAGNLAVDNSYFINNFQDGLEKQNRGDLTLTNVFCADNSSDLDSTNGTAPDQTNVANLKLAYADATVENINITSVTLYNSHATTNDNAFLWTQSNANTLNASNVIYAGTGDQASIANDTTGGAAIYNETNSAVVQAGPDALESPFFTIGASVTSNVTHQVTADPAFASTTFAPVWNGNTAPVTGLTNYLMVTSLAYTPTREAGAGNITGANPNSSLNARVEDFILY